MGAAGVGWLSQCRLGEAPLQGGPHFPEERGAPPASLAQGKNMTPADGLLRLPSGLSFYATEICKFSVKLEVKRDISGTLQLQSLT